MFPGRNVSGQGSEWLGTPRPHLCLPPRPLCRRYMDWALETVPADVYDTMQLYQVRLLLWENGT